MRATNVIGLRPGGLRKQPRPRPSPIFSIQPRAHTGALSAQWLPCATSFWRAPPRSCSPAPARKPLTAAARAIVPVLALVPAGSLLDPAAAAIHRIQRKSPDGGTANLPTTMAIPLNAQRSAARRTQAAAATPQAAVGPGSYCRLRHALRCEASFLERTNQMNGTWTWPVGQQCLPGPGRRRL